MATRRWVAGIAMLPLRAAGRLRPTSCSRGCARPGLVRTRRRSPDTPRRGRARHEGAPRREARRALWGGGSPGGWRRSTTSRQAFEHGGVKSARPSASTPRPRRCWPRPYRRTTPSVRTQGQAGARVAAAIAARAARPCPGELQPAPPSWRRRSRGCRSSWAPPGPGRCAVSKPQCLRAGACGRSFCLGQQEASCRAVPARAVPWATTSGAR